MTATTPYGARPSVDISPFRKAGGPAEYVVSFDSGRAGPHVLLNALTHGNEICGAAALVDLLNRDLRPTRGRLTLVFANVAAYALFDPQEPYVARFVDCDFNRIWSDDVLDGPRINAEIARARALRPVYRSADVLLDLHSMSGDWEPLLLCGPTAQGRRLARDLALTDWTAADAGHRAGPRLIDYAGFTAPDAARTAVLLECGPHWRDESARVAVQSCLRLLHLYDMLEPRFADAAPAPIPAPRLVAVTHAVTARTDRFVFVAADGTETTMRGVEIIPQAGTVFARDGDAPAAAPYDDCVLVMPTRNVCAGQTAVRLGRPAAW